MIFLPCQIPKLAFYKTKINFVDHSVNSDLMATKPFSTLKPGKRLSLIHSASHYDYFIINIFLILKKKTNLFFSGFLFFSFLFIIIMKAQLSSSQNGSDILPFKNRLIIPEKKRDY